MFPKETNPTKGKNLGGSVMIDCTLREFTGAQLCAHTKKVCIALVLGITLTTLMCPTGEQGCFLVSLCPSSRR